MFAIPLISSKKKGFRTGWMLQAGSASGMLITLMFVLLSVFPIIEVANRWIYSTKIVVVVVGLNILGLGIYGAGKRRAAAEGSPREIPRSA